MAVPLLDLKRQFDRVEEDVRTRMERVLQDQAFILGSTDGHANVVLLCDLTRMALRAWTVVDHTLTPPTEALY